MSESVVGFMVTATRQKSGRSLYGSVPRAAVCRSPGGENWPAGMTCAMVTVVSFSVSALRLSHEEPNAGTADRDAKIQTIHFIVEIFMGSLRRRTSIHSRAEQRATVGAVYDRAYLLDSTNARGHRPRLQFKPLSPAA